MRIWFSMNEPEEVLRRYNMMMGLVPFPSP
jgi:hypothetical protein